MHGVRPIPSKEPKKMTESATRPSYRIDLSTAIVLGLLILALNLVVLLWLDRYETGTLVLTESGCQVLAASGVEPEPVSGSTLCRIHARFEFARRPDRFGTLRIESPRGPSRIALPGHVIAGVTSR
jgi:hypothetical protein